MPKPIHGEAGSGMHFHQHEFKADVFSWTDEMRATIRPLPASLKESLDELEADHDFLLAGTVFTGT
jgi:glutamine synthetase